MERSDESDTGIDMGIRAVGPAAKVRALSWDQCLCHASSRRRSEAEEVIHFQERSWFSLHKAAGVRQDETFEFLRKENVTAEDEPRGVYHRRCYQDYTNKTNLNRVQKRRLPLVVEEGTCSTTQDLGLQDLSASAALHHETPGAGRSSRSTRSISRSDLTKCIICQDRQMATKHTEEALSRCEMDSAVASIMEAARIRDDSRVLLATEDGKLDFFAAEVCYHRSCYMAYTSKTNLLSVQKRQRQCCWSEETGERDATDRALFKLVGYVQSRILDESKIISMAQIEGKFQQYLEEICQERYPFRRDKLKTKLCQYFAGKIEFCRCHVSSKPDLVYSSSLTKGQLIEACVNHMTTDAEDIDYGDLATPYVTASYANLHPMVLKPC